jgi:hypothetical protein
MFSQLRFFIPLIFFGALLPAQVMKSGLVRAGNCLDANKIVVEKYSVPKNISGKNVLVLETPFAQAEFISPLLASVAKNKLVEKVQLVYTTFRVSETFDQQKLNQQRLKNLYGILPDAFSNVMTEWELVAQTGAHSPEEGKTFFHGFVITWRDGASPELVKEEMNHLDSIFMPGIKRGDFTSTSTIDSAKDSRMVLTTLTGKKIYIDHDIPEDSLWYFIRSSGSGSSVINAKYEDTTHKAIIVTELYENGYRVKQRWLLDEHKGAMPTHSLFEGYDPNNPDSVIMAVMRRNNFHDITFVCDVTGSMSPYTAQIFAWLPIGLAGSKCSSFVFFNDGDKKATGDKTIGKTGGIYGIRTQRFDSVYYVARQTMEKGDGGDLMENPVEASIWAVKKFNPTGDIVLVADNFSSPRDLELYEKLNKPVHIILCGARGTVNPDYLVLARKTHGTIHTLTDDVTGLDQMKSGDVIKIGNFHYLLRGEHFICEEMFNNL